MTKPRSRKATAVSNAILLNSTSEFARHDNMEDPGRIESQQVVELSKAIEKKTRGRAEIYEIFRKKVKQDEETLKREWEKTLTDIQADEASYRATLTSEIAAALEPCPPALRTAIASDPALAHYYPSSPPASAPGQPTGARQKQQTAHTGNLDAAAALHPAFANASRLLSHARELIHAYDGLEAQMRDAEGKREVEEWERERSEVERLVAVGERVVERKIEGLIQGRRENGDLEGMADAAAGAEEESLVREAFKRFDGVGGEEENGCMGVLSRVRKGVGKIAKGIPADAE